MEPPESIAPSAPSQARGSHLWTRQVGGVDDYAKAQVTLNDLGFTSLLDLVILQLSAQGEPLGAVGTGVPEQDALSQPLQLATEAAGVIVARTGSASQPASVSALSWQGTTRWTHSMSEFLPEGCQPLVTSVATHPLFGVRAAGSLSGPGAGTGVCGTNRRAFVTALAR